MTRSVWQISVGLATALAVMLSLASLHAQSSVDGEWSETFGYANLEAIHSTLLPTGKVASWSFSTNNFKLWDPVTGLFTNMATPVVDIFCAGHTWLPDGRLLVVGGTLPGGGQNGEAVADIYDPYTNTWANNDGNPNNDVPAMNAGRWYPSATTLGNGDVLVMSGDITEGNVNSLPQVYEVATNSWRDLTTANKGMPLYPRTFLAPDGSVVSLTNWNNKTEKIDVTGTGSWSFLDYTLDADLANYGTAVMYDTGKVAYIGGGYNPTEKISLMDIGSANPQWTRAAGTMAQPRRQHDATILADGTILITGGTSSGSGFNNPAGAIYRTEIWDPVTGQVSQVADADQDIYRGYHSTATLLPDGRVLITGGDQSEGGWVSNKNAQIYSPAYLFNGNRPTVTSAPDVVGYGETFFVETPDAASIADALWIIPGSATHSQDWSQRANYLEFSVVAGGLEITVTGNSNEAPPGNYMLFLINDEGVPSMAEWVQASLDFVPNDGDFDNNGDTDGADFLAWQRDPTVGSLSDWESNYGSTSSLAAETAVPEPGTLGILLLGFASVAGARRRRVR